VQRQAIGLLVLMDCLETVVSVPYNALIDSEQDEFNTLAVPGVEEVDQHC
jgi:hypothetical protein